MNNPGYDQAFFVNQTMARRIGHCQVAYYLPALEEPIPEKPQPEPTRGQWDIVNQLRAEVRGWRKKHAEILLAYDKVKSSKKKSQY